MNVKSQGHIGRGTKSPSQEFFAMCKLVIAPPGWDSLVLLLCNFSIQVRSLLYETKLWQMSIVTPSHAVF